MYYQIIVFTQTVFWTKSLKTIKMLLLIETRVERQQNNEGQSDVWRGGGDCPEGHMSGHCGDGACTHDQTGIRTKINRCRRRRRRRLAGRDSTQVRAMTTPVNTPPILQYSAPPPVPVATSPVIIRYHSVCAITFITVYDKQDSV